MNSNTMSLFATPASRIEGEAIRQLGRVATLPGMLKVAGFPDLHPGKGSPVGAAMLSQGVVYPYLVGSDSGCGMGLYVTDIAVAKAKPEKWSKKLRHLEEPWDGDTNAWLEDRGVQGDGHNRSLGTIGGGNHFAELLRIKEIHDRESFQALGLEEGRIFLLAHSGSRGLGEALLRSHTDRFRDAGLPVGSEEAARYLQRHANALAWSRANRELIALRLLEQLGSGYRAILDLIHNSVTVVVGQDGPLFLHRKGAAPSDAGAVVIPGSRGATSYLVKSRGDQKPNLWSLAHGAGRKWNRSECAGRLRDRYHADSLRRTGLGSYVICEDRDLLYEEAPQAYKDIEAVIQDMVSLGLITVIASFTPLLTYKVRER